MSAVVVPLKLHSLLGLRSAERARAVAPAATARCVAPLTQLDAVCDDDETERERERVLV